MCCLIVSSSPRAVAQGEPPPAAPPGATVTGYFRDLSRVESWSFFEPRPGGGDPDYSFFANRATLGVRVTSRRLDVDGAFQYAQIMRVAADARSGRARSAPAACTYFSAENTEAFQLYFKTMMLRVKDVFPGVSFAAGRMSYSSGEETRVGLAVDRRAQASSASARG